MDKAARLNIAEEAEKMHREGMSRSDIAEYFGKTPQTMRNYRSEWREEMTKKNILQKTLNEAEKSSKISKKEVPKIEQKELEKPQKGHEKEQKKQKKIPIELNLLIFGFLVLLGAVVVIFIFRRRPDPNYGDVASVRNIEEEPGQRRLARIY